MHIDNNRSVAYIGCMFRILQRSRTLEFLVERMLKLMGRTRQHRGSKSRRHREEIGPLIEEEHSSCLPVNDLLIS